MQQNLLDTHALIWFINGDTELSPTARAAIETENIINFVSIASFWEMAIKISLDKLELKTPFNQISRQIEENGFEIIAHYLRRYIDSFHAPFSSQRSL